MTTAPVKVWNLNTLPFDVTWRGDKIHIPAQGFIEMDWEDANVFVKTPFKSILRDGMGRDLPEGKQMLRIERDGDIAKYAKPILPHCPVCKEQVASWEALDAHTEKNHADQVLQDEEYKKYLEKKKGSASATKPAGGAAQPAAAQG